MRLRPLLLATALGASVTAWAGSDGGGQTLADGICVDGATPEVCAAHERGARPERRDAALHRRRARALRAPGGSIEDPCADGVSGCAPALAGAWTAFDRAAFSGGRAGVVVFGNSLIAANRIVNVLRWRLQEQLGDGGRGLLLADRLGVVGPRDRTADDAEGWVTGTVADVERQPGVGAAPEGLAGAVHVSTGRAVSRFRLDGDVLHRFLLPDGARRLELRAPKAGAAVHGVVVEHDRGGVVVDTLGVAAADARRFGRVDAGRFQRQLDARRPDLVVLMLGGNETKRIAWGQEDRAAIEEQLRALIGRVAPGPDRSCLVVGPIDAVVGADKDLPEGADPMRQRPELMPVNALHRQVALEEGCAFFDLFAAMGGTGSLQRLQEQDALHDDLVHPKELGLGVLGQLIADAVLREWRLAGDIADDVDASGPPPARDAPFAVTTTLDEGRADGRPTSPTGQSSL